MRTISSKFIIKTGKNKNKLVRLPNEASHNLHLEISLIIENFIFN